MMMGRFAGKVALITGGATGIGLATARRFASEGAKVAILGDKHEAGLAAKQQLDDEGRTVMFCQGDVTCADSVRQVVHQVIDTFGKIDILVNNAAVSAVVDFLDSEPEKWKQVFNVIVDGAYHCSQMCAQHMVERKIAGHIINVSSINSYRALAGSSHYNAAKGALDQLTRCLAVELIEHGIHVNGVNPGFVATPMSVVAGENELESDWFKQTYVEGRKIPLQRAARPDEVASVISFLASEDASYICGSTIPVDGGLSITF